MHEQASARSLRRATRQWQIHGVIGARSKLQNHIGASMLTRALLWFVPLSAGTSLGRTNCYQQ